MFFQAQEIKRSQAIQFENRCLNILFLYLLPPTWFMVYTTRMYVVRITKMYNKFFITKHVKPLFLIKFSIIIRDGKK